MVNAKQRLAKLVGPHFERAKRIDGFARTSDYADALGLTKPQLARAARGEGPADRVLDLCDRGAINPGERAEVVYLLTGVWPVGGAA
jgi:hypothetical protein